MEVSAVYARWKCGAQNKKQAWSILIWKQIFARLNIILDQTSTLLYVASFLSLYWLCFFQSKCYFVYLSDTTIFQVGSVDHHIHYFDLRNPSAPVHIFGGHKKAVSYVKFLSNNELASASTDSTLRLWDVKDNCPVCSFWDNFFIWHSCLLSFCSIGNCGAIFV